MVTEQGGFEDYQPVSEIPPYGRFILQLQPRACYELLGW
jgi:hypothetical protein